jgi:hypothetical protein
MFGLLIRGNCSVERDGFAPGLVSMICRGAGVKAGRLDEEGVGVFEGDAGGFSIDGERGGALEAGVADGERGTAGCATVAGEMVPIPSGTAAHVHENRLSAGGDARGGRRWQSREYRRRARLFPFLHRVQEIDILRSEISQDS